MANSRITNQKGYENEATDATPLVSADDEEAKTGQLELNDPKTPKSKNVLLIALLTCYMVSQTSYLNVVSLVPIFI